MLILHHGNYYLGGLIGDLNECYKLSIIDSCVNKGDIVSTNKNASRVGG